MSSYKAWVEEAIRSGKKLDIAEEKSITPLESEVLRLGVRQVLYLAKTKELNVGTLLCSLFDLIVSAMYYRKIGNTGWWYCRDEEPRFFYHYTNCCPRHAIKNQFVFNKSGKLDSASIGTTSAKVLRLLIKEVLNIKNPRLKVYKGSEPIDIIILDEESKKIFLGEIKASPLMTLPLSIKADEQFDYTDSERIIYEHKSAEASTLLGKEIELFIPQISNGEWKSKYYTLGKIENPSDKLWSLRGLIELLKDEEFLYEYYLFWLNTFDTYYPKRQNGTFWLTNGCGQPNPRPSDWPKKDSSFESISDSKTSVGMDRTDDIKKGFYQIIKLGRDSRIITNKDMETKEKGEYSVSVGIVSNIHAARHFHEYIESIKELVWTIDKTTIAQNVKDLDQNLGVFRLFDGLISFSKPLIFDEWLQEIFQFVVKKDA